MTINTRFFYQKMKIETIRFLSTGLTIRFHGLFFFVSVWQYLLVQVTKQFLYLFLSCLLVDKCRNVEHLEAKTKGMLAQSSWRKKRKSFKGFFCFTLKKLEVCLPFPGMIQVRKMQTVYHARQLKKCLSTIVD